MQQNYSYSPDPIRYQNMKTDASDYRKRGGVYIIS